MKQRYYSIVSKMDRVNANIIQSLIMTLLLAGLAAILYGISDFFGGIAVKQSPVLPVLALLQVVGLAIISFILLMSGHLQLWPGINSMCYGVLAGISGLFGFLTLYNGIANSIVAIVSPISAVMGASLPIVFTLYNGEQLSFMAIIGSIICLVAIVLLTTEPNGFINREYRPIQVALCYGLLSGFLFGIFFISLAHCSHRHSLWALAIAKSTAISIIIIIAIATKESFYISNEGLVPGLVAGAADVVANISFMLAIKRGIFYVVIIITSLFPAPTVILSRLFLRQKIPVIRYIGLAMALVGVVLISCQRP